MLKNCMNNKYLLLLFVLLFILLIYLLKINLLVIKEGNKQCGMECPKGMSKQMCTLRQQIECDGDSFKSN